jgi:hypothetical protein
MTMRHLLTTAVAVLALLAACSRQEPAATATTSTTSRPVGASAMLHGADAASLQAYLRGVQEVKATKFEVTWSPRTVRVDREAALRSLRTVSRDGAVFTFTPDEPSVAALAEGKVLFIWGVALRKVTAVERTADALRVTTAPAALQEAIANGEIEFAHQPLLRDYIAVPNLTPSGPPRRAMLDAPRVMYASYRPARLLRVADAPAPAEATDPEPVGSNGFTGSVGSFQYSISYVPGPGGLDFDLQLRKEEGPPSTSPDPAGGVRKAEEQQREKTSKDIGDERLSDQERAAREAERGARGAPKVRDGGGMAHAAFGKLFELASDGLDLRIQARGKLQGLDGSDRLAIGSHIVIRDGAVSLLNSQIGNLKGDVAIRYVVRRSDQTTQWIEKVRHRIPLTFNVPIIVGGLPLMLQIGFDVIMQPALVTQNDAFSGEFAFKFGGGASTSVAQGAPSASGDMSGEGEAKAAQASSIGVSALLIALQAPRIGLGMGLFGASAVGYMDMVTSMTATSGGTLGLLPCKQWTANWTINAGVDAQIALLQRDFRSEPLLAKKWYRLEPDVKGCETK